MSLTPNGSNRVSLPHESRAFHHPAPASRERHKRDDVAVALFFWLVVIGLMLWACVSWPDHPDAPPRVVVSRSAPARTLPVHHAKVSPSTSAAGRELTVRMAAVLIAEARARQQSVDIGTAVQVPSGRVVSPNSRRLITGSMASVVPMSTAGDYHSWADWPLWRCIGQHEQGAARGGPYDSNGDGIAWHGSDAGGGPGSGYPGGLGIMSAAWDDARGAAGVTVTNGAYASPGDQIRVARVIEQRFGLHAWATWRLCS